MELIGAAAVVYLPARLTAPLVTDFAIDLQRAIASTSRVVELRGADARVFCTGLALDGDVTTLTQTQAFAGVLSTLASAPKPTLAVVHGEALGGGLGLAAACDWVIASSTASFGLPELLWGVIPAMIWPFVVDRMSESAARRWTISAHARPASEALATGLADEIAEPLALPAAGARAGRRLSRLEPVALAHLRRWSRTVRDQDLDRILSQGASLTAAMAAEPHVRRRWEAFREGETPWD